MWLLWTAAFANPPPIDAVAIALAFAAEGSWRVRQTTGAACDDHEPVAARIEHRELLPEVPHPHWSQPTLTVEHFPDAAQASAHLHAWGEGGAEGVGLGMGHTKSWTRKVAVGATVWELWAPCATDEPIVRSMELALEAALHPQGPWYRCTCGGACVPGDPEQRATFP